MTLKDIREKLGLGTANESDRMDVEVRRGYVSDLLSDVIAHAGRDDVWVTIQVHKNIVAVAVLKEIAGIIVANGKKLHQDTIDGAREQNVAVLTSELPGFEIVGRLHGMGVQGK
jgi:hypothetical protein